MSALMAPVMMALRASLQQPWTALLKLVGFVIGFVGCILILAFVNYESHYDAWLSQGDRIARVIQIRDVKTGQRSVSPPYPFADAARTDIPGVVATARMQPLRIMLQQGQARFNEVALFVDPAFLQVFDVTIDAGASNPLENPYSAVLSRRAAFKYFGRTDVVGSRLLLGGKQEVTVTAVMPNWRADSHLSPDVLLPLESFFQMAKENGNVDRERITGWDNCQCYPTYLLFDRADRFAAADAALRDTLVRHQGEDYAARLPLFLQHVTDAYLDSNKYRTYLDHAKKGDRVQLLVFLAIAFVLLLISGVNFANLSVAEATRRAKEVGMRRILGATRTDVNGQLIGEALAFATVALVLSFGVAALLISPFASFVARPIAVDTILAPMVIGQVVLAAVLATAVAGSVPALLLSRAEPVALLRESATSDGRLLSGGRLRQIMVMLQILVSTALIVGSLAIYSQIAYVRHLPRGFVMDDKLVVNGEGSHDAFGEISAQLAALPTVTRVSIANALPTTQTPSPQQLLRQGAAPTDARGVVINDIDFGFFSALGVRSVAGRLFDPNFGSDSYRVPDKADEEREVNVVVNQAAAAELGFASPDLALDQVVRAADKNQAALAMRIVGVVENIRYGSPKEAVQPMVYRARVDWNVNRHEPRFFLVSSTDPGNPQLQENVRQLWIRLVPGFVSDATPMTTRLTGQLRGEQQQFRMVLMFTGAALLISVLGVLGLAAFVMRRRAKELAVRRVVGASPLQIAQLVSMQQMRHILVAVVLSLPLSYWMILRWLQNFDLRVPVSWSWFAGGALLSLCCAFLLLLAFTARVAAASPVRYLKDS
ncbi:ABC transporter permease [Tahibacter amnicola]|uniref:ABC transporter permease n=1 Tax=Tahibacter amnicola TaxID=2976241 RepID=A0ABY6B8D3_9GAMM|nr:ABC transporter permease [Tahibacter amnicola]UXI66274.1 ABC transporter permease [Tahibacter amnicola]